MRNEGGKCVNSRGAGMGMSLRPLFLLWSELEVLIVFEGVPRASPGEAVAKEKAVAEVACFDLVAELARTICIRTAIGRLYVL